LKIWLLVFFFASQYLSIYAPQALLIFCSAYNEEKSGGSSSEEFTGGLTTNLVGFPIRT
jgi:hypothetical protein